MLLCESLNLIISRLHCWAVKLKAIIKRSEVESSLACSLSVLYAWCASMQSRWKQNLSSAMCLTAVNICWDICSQIPQWQCPLNFIVNQNSLITYMAPDIMADMANDDCVHIRWLDAFWPVWVMFGAYSWSFYEWRIVCLWPTDNFDVFCVFVSKETHNI